MPFIRFDIVQTSMIETFSQLPPALRALLTNNSIVKLGLRIKQNLLGFAAHFNDTDMTSALNSTTSIIELTNHATLKGVTSDISTPLDKLASRVLKKSFASLSDLDRELWDNQFIKQLHHQVDCIWQIYHSLSTCDSVGLPLTQLQKVLDGHPVTLFHADKAVAEGLIISPHPGSIEAPIDEKGTRRRINITASRSLIKLTRVLAGTSIHTLHSQCIQWVYDHGPEIVVTTSTLRTRGINPTTPSTRLQAVFSNPAPPSYPLEANNIPPFIPSIPDETETFSQVMDDEDENNELDSELDSDEDDIENIDEEVGNLLLHKCSRTLMLFSRIQQAQQLQCLLVLKMTNLPLEFWMMHFISCSALLANSHESTLHFVHSLTIFQMPSLYVTGMMRPMSDQ